ncbi:MAG: hypothetical protein J0M11_10940 [Anaerolineae bacterium]|nr:hypothetical protein [Anaerolineae bacterium]
MKDYQNIYNENANSIITSYTELVEHIKTNLFPWWEIKFIEIPNLDRMNNWQRVLADTCAPYILVTHPSARRPKKVITYYYWFIVSVVWLALLTVFLTNNPTISDGSSTELNQFTGILVLFLLFTPSIYIYFFTTWFLITKRVTGQVKISWSISLLTVSFFLFQTATSHNLNLKILLNLETSYLFLLLILIPLIAFLGFNFLFLGKSIVELAINIGRSFFASHSVIPQNTMQNAISKPVKSENKDWQISTLNIEKINTIKELASNNLEATEKKTIPAAIILALIGFLATLPIFQKLFGNLIQVLYEYTIEIFIPRDNLSLTFGQYAVTISIFIIAFAILSTYLSLFRNLIIQGLLIQICTIAEYTKKEIEIRSEQQKRVEEFKIDSLFSFISKVLSIFRRD